MTQEQTIGAWAALHQEALRSTRLPAKFRSVSMAHEGIPMGRCLLEPVTPYFIDRIERTDLRVVFRLVFPLNDRYRLPEQYAAVVSDDDINDVNRRKVFRCVN
jgi:hypothetical protein